MNLQHVKAVIAITNIHQLQLIQSGSKVAIGAEDGRERNLFPEQDLVVDDGGGTSASQLLKDGNILYVYAYDSNVTIIS